MSFRDHSFIYADEVAVSTLHNDNDDDSEQLTQIYKLSISMSFDNNFRLFTPCTFSESANHIAKKRTGLAKREQNILNIYRQQTLTHKVF